ncbi:hypothetical protein FFLO_05223 [Filobasidium floriforme]|uniref:Transposase n=1 Tax=Filobasidium floriforme TaxID=5210 RepID=A0A8K0JH83_9TREE|nr:uncharacterized protein HD553DRAFT_269779 [Filobasidium floriforme]KAG7530175.1 hypothetical protein FFLO_05223 [Filobasidium floriforme]KAH8087244.1 hypothetical protein HD553DRAFT_269779 [Filobasidium floriforme]
MLEQLTATAQIAVEGLDRGAATAANADLLDFLDADNATNNWRTAMARLGVSGDNYIQRQICCPECWWLTPLDQLSTLETPVCGAPLSDGHVCEARIYSAINTTRTPYKIVPYVPLSTWLALFMQDAEFVSNLQHWRDEAMGDLQSEVLDPAEPVVPREAMMRGVSDGSAWRSFPANVIREVDADYTVRDEPIEGAEDAPFRHTFLHYGLNIILNVDWFRVKGMPGYSVGAVYAAVANLPRHMMFRKKWTALLCVIPGPEEPSLTFFNRILQPIVDDFTRCENGVYVPTHSCGRTRYAKKDDLELVCTRLLFTACDLPATKKVIGAVSHAHGRHPCHHCGVTLVDVNTAAAYDWRRLPPKEADSAELLRQAFLHKDARTGGEAKAIEDEYGVRYSVLNGLTGMSHSKSAPVDPLHNLYLGLVKSFVNLLCDNDLFEGELDGTPRIELFAGVFNRARYPGHLGRLPSKVTRQVLAGRAAGLKADQWKRIAQLLVHALSPARRSREGEEDVPFRRNRSLWFAAAVSLCAGIRILDSHFISLSDAEDAVEDLAICSRTILRLGGRLTINWHNAMHYAEHIKLYGPISSFSCWAFERNNGTLARVNHNTKERDIPSTIIRAWIREACLGTVLHNPSPTATATELAAIEALIADPELARGTVMLNEIMKAALRARLPAPLKTSPVNLDQYEHSHQALLRYVNEHHPDYQFVGNLAMVDRRPYLPVRSERYLIYTHVIYHGFKFCSALYNRSVRDQWALASMTPDSRDLVRIRLFLTATLVVRGKPPLNLELVLVDTYQTADRGHYPWSHRNIDLGYKAYLQDPEPEPRFLPIASLQASVITAKATNQVDGPILVAMSCDRDGGEPEFWLQSDGPQQDAVGIAENDI